MKRIDFDMFKPVQKKVVSGGLLSEVCKELLSDNEQLHDVLSKIEPCALIYWVSDNDWSMHELLTGILDITGPADVWISSHALGEKQARVLSSLKDAGMILHLYCVLDSRVDVRTAGSLQMMTSISDILVLIDTHAKVTVIKNTQWQVAVIGSANYTGNRRYEAGIISLNPAAVDMQIGWIQKAMQDGMERGTGQ